MARTLVSAASRLVSTLFPHVVTSLDETRASCMLEHLFILLFSTALRLSATEIDGCEFPIGAVAGEREYEITRGRYHGDGDGSGMTTREALHQLVDDLPEDQAELARVWLEDLHHAADEDGPPLDPETLASLDRGIADVAGAV